MPTQPLSPHLTVYRFAYTMALSIIHRITGVAQTTGLALLAFWLMAAASGPVAYARAQGLLGLPLFKLMLASWLLAFVYHLCNGVRHLFWDAGWGLEKSQARRSAWGVVLIALVLFAFLAWRAFVSRGTL
jgi:succinate dehydrogenase / fumarate reductase cytochrome b subunit